MSEAEYRKALKRENDRENEWRKTSQGAFESGFASIDEFAAGFDDPGKIAAFSDRGAGEAGIFAGFEARDRARQISATLQRLSPRDRAFARAVLGGATWRKMRITKRVFNRRVARLCNKLNALRTSLKATRTSETSISFTSYGPNKAS